MTTEERVEVLERELAETRRELVAKETGDLANENECPIWFYISHQFKRTLTVTS